MVAPDYVERSHVISLPVSKASKEIRALARHILGHERVYFFDLAKFEEMVDEHLDETIVLEIEGIYHQYVPLEGTTIILDEFILFDKTIARESLDLFEMFLIHEKIHQDVLKVKFKEEMEILYEAIEAEVLDRLEGLYPENLEELGGELVESIYNYMVNLFIKKLLVEQEGDRAKILFSFFLQHYRIEHPDYYLLLPLRQVDALLNTACVSVLVELFEWAGLGAQLGPLVSNFEEPARAVYETLRKQMMYAVGFESMTIPRGQGRGPAWDSLTESAVNIARVLSEFVSNVLYGIYTRDFYQRLQDQKGIDFNDVLGQISNSFEEPYDEFDDEIDYSLINSIRKFLHERLYNVLHHEEVLTWLDENNIVDLDEFWREFDDLGDFGEVFDDEEDDPGDLFEL